MILRRSRLRHRRSVRVWTISTTDPEEALTLALAPRLAAALRDHLEWIRSEIKWHDDATESRHETLHNARADLWRRIEDNRCADILE